MCKQLICACVTMLALASSGAADADQEEPPPTRLIHLTSLEDVVDQVVSADRERLQGWCAESQRPSDAVAMRVLNPYQPAVFVDVTCAQVQGPECTATSAAPLRLRDNPTGEARQDLSPASLWCFIATLAVGAAMNFSCSNANEDCSPWASWGGVGSLGSVCLFF